MIRLAAALAIAVMSMGCRSGPARQPPEGAESRAIEFLKREVPAWSRENGCFSCHNNGDAARALYAAGRAGHRIPAGALADTTAWVARPSQWSHNKGDPGFSDQRLANIQFAASLLAAWESGLVKDRRPLQDAAQLVAADQEPDGAWHIEPQNPVGSPATYGATLATFMAWQTLAHANAPGTSHAIEHAARWLRSVQPNNVPNAAIRLMVAAREKEQSIDASIEFIRRGQTQDGGWGPYLDSPPEVFDTALVLLALAEIRDRPAVAGMVERAQSFLHSQQSADGSWPATTRPSGGNSYAQQMSTTGWATLALLRAGEGPRNGSRGRNGGPGPR